jgi:hypothetical protein
MSKNVLKHLPELVESGVISQDIADRIASFYVEKQTNNNRLIIVFAILGALLIGLGIILIIAHNWDELSKPVKLSIGLFPLLAMQGLCALALIQGWKETWREVFAVLLMMAVGASISIVSQVYNIAGDLGSFLFTWMLLSIPIIYVMRSKVVSLLVIAGLTWYASYLSFFQYPQSVAWYYWPMLALIIPFYVYLTRQPGKNYQIFHAWFLAVSLVVALAMFGESESTWLTVGYVSMFCGFILLSQFLAHKNIPGANAFLLIGSIFSTVILIAVTYKSWWILPADSLALTNEFGAAIIITAIVMVALVATLRSRPFSSIHPLSFLFLLFLPVYFIGLTFHTVAQVGTNILVLAIALVTTKRGADQNNLVILNYGLAILAILVTCRFFDSELSFAVRGLLFIIVGVSFFGANYYIIRKRKLQQL